MESVLAVAQYTLKEHIRNRIFLAVLLFGVVLLCGGVIISALAVEEQARMLLDVGLSGIEFLSLMVVLFVTVNLVLEEMESKTIYLILSHPIEHWQYILGRFAGTIAALAAGMIMMAALHLGILVLHGVHVGAFYAVAIACSILKITVIGVLALLVSLITTSTSSAMTLTGFLWVLGHFSSEMAYMGEKSANPLVKAFVEFLGYVTPNFSYFNYRDFWNATVTPTPHWFAWMAAYSVAYIAIGLFLSSWIFSKKEF